MRKNKPLQPEPVETPLLLEGFKSEFYANDSELKKSEGPGPAISVVPSERLSILKKLHAIMEEASYVQKTGYRQDQKWKYASDQDVLKTVRKELVKRHILVVPNLLKMWTVNLGEQGGRGYIAHVIIRWDFVCVDTGSCLSVIMPGSGFDVQSTGVYKGITGSDKYALLKTLQFITGDDPEEDNIGSEERRLAEMRAHEAKGADIPGAQKVEHSGQPPDYQDQDFEPWDFNKPRMDADEFGNDFEKAQGSDWWKEVPMKACQAFEKVKPGQKLMEIAPSYLVEMANRWIPHVDDEHHGYRGPECRKLAAACKERLRVEIATGTIIKREEPLADGTVRFVYCLQEQKQKK